MGLDMYLKQEIYVGAKFEHRNVKGSIAITVGGEPLPIQLSKVSTIVLEVGYWRKANAIHNWFVQECQEGVDECQETYVEHEKLMELRDLCVQALKTKKPGKLEPVSGCFFGSTDIDEWFWDSIKETVEILNALDPKGSFYYRASW